MYLRHQTVVSFSADSYENGLFYQMERISSRIACKQPGGTVQEESWERNTLALKASIKELERDEINAGVIHGITKTKEIKIKDKVEKGTA